MTDITKLPLFKDKCYINGAWVGSSDTADVTNPATGDVIGTIPMLSVEQLKDAIDGADKAFQTWKKTTAKHRSAILKKWFDLIMQNQEELATILTVEMGKSMAESRGEVAYGAAFIEWFAEEGKRLNGDIIPNYATTQRSLVIKQPVGVVGAITPWNFPNAMITRKVGPALAAGCTVVLKPATATPYSALALAELAEQAGVPKGVFSVVTGKAREFGAEICSNPIVRKVTFTGSTPVGKILMQQSASTVKKVSMELGGNAPSIVFDDADLDVAVSGIMMSKFRNSGQTCVCTNRIYVDEKIKDAFVAKLSAEVAKLKIGNGLEDGVQQGPLVDMQARDDVHKMVQDAIAQGAKLATGGQPHALGHSFYEPTILTDVTQDMDIANLEIFGPVATVFTFKTEAEAIQKANDTEFGLASYFYSESLSRVWRVSEELEYGIVGVNTGIISSETIPFGGVKESGVGREGSKYGIDDYVEIKHICMSNI